MCGIIAFSDPSVLDKETTIKAMMAMIKHRGPNSIHGGGQYIHDDVALGFQRLSIIDLNGGAQPLYNEDRTVVITFNGEIYNYKALRSELQAAGHVFTTKADTEVLLHGYEEWGMAGTWPRSAGCLPTCFTMNTSRRCTAPGISSASSRCITIKMATPSSSAAKSRPS